MYILLNTHGTNKSINDDAISIKNSFFFQNKIFYNIHDFTISCISNEKNLNDETLFLTNSLIYCSL